MDKAGRWVQPLAYQLALNGLFIGTLTLAGDRSVDGGEDPEPPAFVGKHLELWIR